MTKQRYRRTLQWGHRNSSVEIISFSFYLLSLLLLQWGHRNSSVEIGAYPMLERASGSASMGPPKFIGGNETSSEAGHFLRVKLQWGHRNSSVEIFILPYLPIKGVRLQWGHRNSSVEITLTRTDMLPYKMLQWGHRNSSVEIWILCQLRRKKNLSFNGATEIHRWKYAPFCVYIFFSYNSFNGATEIHRWKFPSRRTGNGGEVELQWGHRNSSVEMVRGG